MPDSTTSYRVLGHKDAPFIPLDGKSEMTDIYAFTTYRELDAGATAAVDPILGSSENVPDNSGFDDKPDITDVYAFTVHGTPGASVTAAVDPVLGGDTVGGDAGNDSLPGGTNKDTIRGSAGVEPAVGDAEEAYNDQLVKVAELFDLTFVESATLFLPDIVKVEFDTGSANTSPPHDGAEALGGRGQPPFKINDLPAVFEYPIVGVESESGSANTSVPGGFPNGRRFGDDVIDIALTAVATGPAASLEVDVGGPAGFPNGAGGFGYPFGDGLYEINPNPGTTDAGPDPAAGVGESFADDDPEYHGDGELIV